MSSKAITIIAVAIMIGLTGCTHIIAKNDEFGWTRVFQQRIKSVISETEFTNFAIPEAGYIEVGFGRSDSRSYYEVATTEEGQMYRLASRPWGKATGEWTAISEPMLPPDDLFDGENW